VGHLVTEGGQVAEGLPRQQLEVALLACHASAAGLDAPPASTATHVSTGNTVPTTSRMQATGGDKVVGGGRWGAAASESRGKVKVRPYQMLARQHVCCTKDSRT
jgi:hypothetical protein